MRRHALGRLVTALLGAALSAFVCAQAPQKPTTEAQARYYVYGAFLTHAVPEIMGASVTLGPELEQRLGVASGGDRQRIYDALMSYTDGKKISVRKATGEELARYRTRRDLKDPVFTVQAGEVTLLVEYDMQANAIPFVGQLGVVNQPPVAAPRAAPRPPPVAAAPAPSPPVVAPPPVTVAPPPVIAPRATPRAVPTPPPPPTVAKPQARVAPAPAPMPVRTGPCEVKPVMTEQDLANCRAVGEARTIQPGPPAVVKPQARLESAPQPRRTAPCEVKPVMTEEDLANCRAAPGGSARVDPGPPPVAARPVAPAAPRKPAAPSPCVVKPVMSEEDLANCRSAPGGSARVDPGPPPVAARPVAPSEPRKPAAATPCVVKPVMSEEDLAACGIRSR